MSNNNTKEDNRKRLHVLYVGDTQTGHFLTSPGVGLYLSGGRMDESLHLRSALGSDGAIEVTHVASGEISELLPVSARDFALYDAIVLSDITADTLLLYSDPKQMPPGPNRLNMIKEYVENGGVLLMIGGWFSFGGFGGQARYHGSPLEEVLPVVIKDGDDRKETPEGAGVKVLEPGHPVLTGLTAWDEVLFAGYNVLKAKPGSRVLLETDSGDPLLVITSWGKGTTCAFASDCGPTWVGTMLSWAGYSKFWCRLIRFLVQGKL
ncbi:MAG: cytoplasmic protein [Deltaproteobacteria bacterium]|nr:cytoplasmic protein [Deltaproteobacteria bacterium]